MFGAALAAGAGSALGSLVGNAVGGGNPNRAQEYNATYVAQLVQNMNNILTDARNSAIGNSEQWTQTAKDELSKYLGVSTDSLTQYLNQATQAATQNTQQGITQATNLAQPYLNLGQGAAGQLANILGTNGANGNNSGYTMKDFFNSAPYQLMYGNNTAMDPSQRFANDAGTQQAIKTGMAALQQTESGKGLSNSGAQAQALADYMYNHYNDYITQQGNLFNTVQQNQVQNLSNATQQGLSASNTLGTNTLNAQTQLAQLLGNANLSTGGQIATNNMTTGQNFGTLSANQGVLNANAYLGTAAAQSNNLFQGAQLLAQTNSASLGTPGGQYTRGMF